MLGVGLAVAVLIDATVVRGILVPAAISLLGERIWPLPAGTARRGSPADGTSPPESTPAADGTSLTAGQVR
jgi:RND superfamily putative drug exporter